MFPVIEVVASPQGSGGQQDQFILPITSISSIWWDQINSTGMIVLNNVVTPNQLIISEHAFQQIKDKFEKSGAIKYIEIE